MIGEEFAAWDLVARCNLCHLLDAVSPPFKRSACKAVSKKSASRITHKTTGI